jgi:RNA polymerase sigma-70 factor (ECF subfamily)
LFPQPRGLANDMHSTAPMYQLREVSEPWINGCVANWTGDAAASSKESDDCLIESVLQGRSDAFGELVAPHLRSLTRFATIRLRNESEAEDVVQQAVLRAYCALGQFRREASFKTWLSRIAFNEVVHMRRGKAATNVRPLLETHADRLADPCRLPDMQIQRRQEMERLHRALLGLPEKYRVVVQLRDLQELSIVATARSLSLTVATVKTRHHRARKLLMRSLRGQ